MSQGSKKSIFKALWERRLPQFFATYLGICWGFLQFLLFACERYNFNSAIVDKYLLFVGLLVPTVLVFIYNHGRPGKDQWNKFEKAFIPTNFIVASIAAFMFGGLQNVDATPTSVEITNDEGEQITRMVPAESQTRQLLLYPFELELEKEDWMRIGLPMLLAKDIEQDARIFTRTPKSLKYHFTSFGYKINEAIPFSVKLEIAKKTQVDLFVTGTIKDSAEGIAADIKFFEVHNGELFFEHSFVAADIFELTDLISKSTSNSLFLKDNSSEFDNFTDLPASDLITKNQAALANYMRAIHHASIDEQYEKGIAEIKEAIAQDDKSAEIKKFAAYAIRNSGDLETSTKLIGEALQLSKQLPERQQFDIKKTYWFYQQELDKGLALMNNWMTLYPKDFEPYKDLMEIYKITMQLDKAKEVALKAIENGHKNRTLKYISDICLKRDEYDEAESYLKEYFETYPDLAKDDTRLGELYIEKGDFDQAQIFYDALLLNDPQNDRLYRKMAKVCISKGEFAKAEKQYKKALEFSKQAIDSSSVYLDQMLYAMERGKTKDFLELSDKRKNLQDTYMTPVQVLQSSFVLAGAYGVMGAKEELFSYYSEATKAFPQMGPAADCVGNFIISLVVGDSTNFKKYYKGDCKEMLIQGSPNMDLLCKGVLESIEGNHKEAIEMYEKYLEDSGLGGRDFGILLAKEYRLLGDFDRAIKYCNEYLSTAPLNGAYLLELATSYAEKGDLNSAKATYEKLGSVWSEAEPRYYYYTEYKALGKRLN